MFSGKKINTQSDSLWDAVELKKNKNFISDTTLKKLLMILYCETVGIIGHRIQLNSGKYSLAEYKSDLNKIIRKAASHILEFECDPGGINNYQKSKIESILTNMYTKHTFLKTRLALKQQKNFNNDVKRNELAVFLEQCIKNIEENINLSMHKLIKSFRYMVINGERVEVSAATAIYGSLESLLTSNIQKIVDRIIVSNIMIRVVKKVDTNLPTEVIKTKLRKLLNPNSQLQELQDEMALMDLAMDYARDKKIAVGRIVIFYRQSCPDGTTDYYTEEMCKKDKAKMNQPVKITILNENDYNNKAKELSEKYQRLQQSI
ncbi:hypothetical protein KMW40_14495 [Enterobacter cloacae]|uniref:hypothetical protein n=1 Tax=Enterobacter cloacae TaxID=550 RepID=UPI0034A15231